MGCVEVMAEPPPVLGQSQGTSPWLIVTERAENSSTEMARTLETPPTPSASAAGKRTGHLR